MASVASTPPSDRQETFASDLAGIFSFLLDPAAAARRLDRKWFWIAPLVIASIVAAIYTSVCGSMVERFLGTSPIPPNTSPEQYAQGIKISTMIFKVFAFAMPVVTAVFALIQAALWLALSSMLAVKVRFLQLFNLVAGISIILTLQNVAWIAILEAKHEIASMTDLKPPLGLDIILPAGTNKFLLATFSFLSIFQIWSIVMTILIYSIAFRTTKGKASAVVIPPVLFFLVLALIGAFFQKS